MKTRTEQIRIEAAFRAEGNLDYQAGFFDGALWADSHPTAICHPYVSAEQFIKDNKGSSADTRQYFLLYCDDKPRIISMDYQGQCYVDVQFMESYSEPVDLSKMDITFYLKIPVVR